MNSLVRDMMTTDVVTVEASTPFREIVARLAARRVSAVPVVDTDSRVLGVVSEADLLLKEEHSDAKQSVPLVWTRRRRIEWEKAAGTVAGELMTAPPVTVLPTAAARRMHAAGVKRLPVVDEDGRLLGIVSRADLLRVFARPDEAIRRDIIDEVIIREFMMESSRFLVRVEDGVVVLEGAVERRTLVPFVVRAVQGVEGVVGVENRLTYDVDDRGADVLMTPWLRP
jgi:CBS domain-containing protein